MEQQIWNEILGFMGHLTGKQTPAKEHFNQNCGYVKKIN